MIMKIATHIAYHMPIEETLDFIKAYSEEEWILRVRFDRN